jgi:hypothetical protein
MNIGEPLTKLQILLGRSKIERASKNLKPEAVSFQTYICPYELKMTSKISCDSPFQDTSGQDTGLQEMGRQDAGLRMQTNSIKACTLSLRKKV